MSRGGWAALPRGATGLSAFVIVVFPDHTHLLVLKCFIITVMGAAILIWQTRDQFLKIAIHRSISVYEAQFCFIFINSNTNNTPG